MEENRERAGWQEVCCLAGRLQLRIPEEYGRPSDEWMALHFPAVPRPQEVYSSPEGNGILTCNLLDKPLREEQVYPAVREIQWLIGRLYPESIRVTAREFRTDACRIGWFAFVTGGTREDSMHCMFVLPLEDNMMFGSWHFPGNRYFYIDSSLYVELSGYHCKTAFNMPLHCFYNASILAIRSLMSMP